VTKERVKTGGETKTDASSREKCRKDNFVFVAYLFLGAAQEKSTNPQKGDATL
jgi:hypothetical protein